jgi:hypothetical protein
VLINKGILSLLILRREGGGVAEREERG